MSNYKGLNTHNTIKNHSSSKELYNLSEKNIKKLAKKIFKKFNISSSGKLETDELSRMLVRINTGIKIPNELVRYRNPNKEIRNFRKTLDFDKNGIVTISDLENKIRQICKEDNPNPYLKTN